MKISYDPETDALYIRLLEGRHECRTVRLNDEVVLNIGPNETLVSIEILDAVQVFGEGGATAVAGKHTSRRRMTILCGPYITRDPAVCGGEPIVTGTRVTVRTVLASLAEGMAIEEIVADFPTLSCDAVRAIIAFTAISAEEDLPLPPAPLLA